MKCPNCGDEDFGYICRDYREDDGILIEVECEKCGKDFEAFLYVDDFDQMGE